MEDLSLTILSEQQNTLQKEIDFVGSEIKLARRKGKQKADTLERKRYREFWAEYNEYHKKIQDYAQRSNLKLQQTQSVLQKTMRYYGEQYPDMMSNDFFGIIMRFIEDVQVHKLNIIPAELDLFSYEIEFSDDDIESSTSEEVQLIKII